MRYTNVFHHLIKSSPFAKKEFVNWPKMISIHSFRRFLWTKICQQRNMEMSKLYYREWFDMQGSRKNISLLIFQTFSVIFELEKIFWKRVRKLMRKNVLLMKNEFAYGTLHIQRIETRAFTQDTSTAKKKSYINNQRLLSIWHSTKSWAKKTDWTGN